MNTTNKIKVNGIERKVTSTYFDGSKMVGFTMASPDEAIDTDWDVMQVNGKWVTRGLVVSVEVTK